MNYQKINRIIAIAIVWLAASTALNAAGFNARSYIKLASDNTAYLSKRPAAEQRLFRSAVIEKKINEVKLLLAENKYLAWMFENCFPNTLDTTVHYDGADDTFVYTGDIAAMWLRDSAAQVWPYVQFANDDPQLKQMLHGVIMRQLRSIIIDPYANAFNPGPKDDNEWASDITDMKPELHERKYEIDSLCYPLRLAYHYWQVTGDASVFGKEWIDARALSPANRQHSRSQGHQPALLLHLSTGNG